MSAPELHTPPYMNRPDGTVQAFVGKRWQLHATGPDAFDCWTLARAAAWSLFGLNFPAVPYVAPTPAGVARAAAGYLRRTRWAERDTAAQGAILALCGFDGTVRHVALCLDASRCLHIAGATRSCVLPVRRLAASYPRARVYEWQP